MPRGLRMNPLFLSVAAWIASRSLSSGAHSRDPLARNDARLFHLLFPGAARLFYPSLRRAQRRSNPLFLSVAGWVGSRSLSSGAHSRDPLARNDARLFHLLFPGAARLFYSVIARSAATKQSILSFCR